MPDDPIPSETLERLLREGSLAWQEFSHAKRDTFHYLIPADQRTAYDQLLELRDGARSFLELGSGAGVITILADLVGFEAYGIEIEPELVEASQLLADEFSSSAVFVEGSFVPTGYRERIELLSGDHHTVVEGADAYDELGMELADFDLVYVYPWPDEEEWIHQLVREHAGPHTRLLTYSVQDGFLITEL